LQLAEGLLPALEDRRGGEEKADVANYVGGIPKNPSMMVAMAGTETMAAMMDALGQWRTLPIIVGGAKSHYIAVEEANLKYFVFYMVKNCKY
jgi:hypothetical protein